MDHKVDRETFGFIAMGSHEQFTVIGDVPVQAGGRICLQCEGIEANLLAVATSVTTKFGKDVDLYDAMREGYTSIEAYSDYYGLDDDVLVSIVRFTPIGRM